MSKELNVESGVIEDILKFIESYLVTTVEPLGKMHHIDEPEWKSVKQRLLDKYSGKIAVLSDDQNLPGCPDYGYGLDAAAFCQQAFGKAMVESGWRKTVDHPCQW